MGKSRVLTPEALMQQLYMKLTEEIKIKKDTS